MLGISIYDYWPAIVRTRPPPVAHPLVVEVGVHDGVEFARLAGRSPTGSADWIGFEPDPRSIALLRERGITVIEKAASDHDGEAEFWLSGGWTPGSGETRWHTDSSSLNRPTKHLEVAPWCRFEERIKVPTVRLDTALPDRMVDLMWIDVQGAQRKVLAGAPETLQRTRYLFIECHPVPMYEEEPTFAELRGLLPDFALVKRWEGEALFRNTRLTPRWHWHFARVTALNLLAGLFQPIMGIRRRLSRLRSRDASHAG